MSSEDQHNPDKHEFHIPIASQNRTAIDCLAESTGMSKQKLKQYMQKGCVWLERGNAVVDKPELSLDNEAVQKSYIQRLRRAKKVLNENDILHFYYDESVLLTESPKASLLEDFGDYSVWNKPSGMLSQGSKWGDHCTIYRWAEKNLLPERPAFVVHRLDRAANGLMILAHKKSVASQFARMFEKREVEKQYLVEVVGDFSNKVTEKGSLTINTLIDERTAISHVRFSGYDSIKKTSIVEVDIETGRKHQIRKHLLSVGFPVVGDRLYGGQLDTITKDTVDLQLKAKRLGFICPITAEKRVFVL